MRCTILVDDKVDGLIATDDGNELVQKSYLESLRDMAVAPLASISHRCDNEPMRATYVCSFVKELGLELVQEPSKPVCHFHGMEIALRWLEVLPLSKGLNELNPYALSAHKTYRVTDAREQKLCL